MFKTSALKTIKRLREKEGLNILVEKIYLQMTWYYIEKTLNAPPKTISTDEWIQ